MVIDEADSYEFHSSRDALRRGVHCYTDLVVRGWRVVCFTWESVMFEPRYVHSCFVASIGIPRPRLRSVGPLALVGPNWQDKVIRRPTPTLCQPARGSERMASRLPPVVADNDIEVECLVKAFYDTRRKVPVVAVENASFSVRRGEFLSICGPSGCGKSTILRVLAGLEQQTLGEFRVAGDGRNPAMVFQESSLFPWLNVQDNVAYGLALRGVRKRERRERVQPLLAMAGLAEWTHAYPHQLSGGMKQRASVARALADDEAGVLLMDEPFGALDEQTRVGLQQELLRIWERERKTVVFITHSIEEALTLSDRVLVMSARPGRIISEIDVPFERPRDAIELRREQLFGELSFRIWDLLRAEHGPTENAVDA